MHALTMPSTLGELAFLGLIIAGFAAFVFTLLGVSTYVTLYGAETERPVERKVTPARRHAPAAVREA